ncbi:uncharacterized protein ABDE67_016694 [Symphorus nematophorus]
MANYITHLDVSFEGANEQRLQSNDFKKINVDLNKEEGGKSIFLWYKKGSGSPGITRVQLTFNKRMEEGMRKAGYVPLTITEDITIWFLIGSMDECYTPIVDLDITLGVEGEGQMFCNGWERLACSLNRNAGWSWFHFWVKRELPTYICDVSATDSYGSNYNYFKEGYIRMDEDINRFVGGSDVFIWFRQTTDSKRALNDLKVSTNDLEYQALRQQNYQPVSVDLNQGTGGNKVYLWYKKEGKNKPIRAITLLVNPDAPEVYEKAGASVIRKNLNAGTKGFTEYLCVNQ